MIIEAQKSKKSDLNLPQTENVYPLEINDYELNRYEKKILLPHPGISALKSSFTQISGKKSPRYDWHYSAPLDMWASDEEDDLTRRYQQEFRNFVHFDRLIDYYQIRPVKILFRDAQGIQQKYQPLALLTYSQDLSYMFMKPTLVDVRSDNEIRTNWKLLYPALRAANRYAKANGWRFFLIRDYFFNTPLFYNACFLRRFRDYPAKDPYFNRLIDEIRRLKKMTIRKLLEQISQNADEHDEILPQLWHLLDTNFVSFDVTQPLNLNSEIWFD